MKNAEGMGEDNSSLVKYEVSNMSVDGKQGKIRRRWTSEEDELLKHAVKIYGGSRWKAIADMVPNRTHVQCLQRWSTSLRPDVVKGRWTREEDHMLLEIKRKYPHFKHWGFAARLIPGRTAKQCRERYKNHLDPGVRKGEWTSQEDRYLLESFARNGNRWATISAHLPGRTENSVKARLAYLQKSIPKDKVPTTTGFRDDILDSKLKEKQALETNWYSSSVGQIENNSFDISSGLRSQSTSSESISPLNYSSLFNSNQLIQGPSSQFSARTTCSASFEEEDGSKPLDLMGDGMDKYFAPEMYSKRAAMCNESRHQIFPENFMMPYEDLIGKEYDSHNTSFQEIPVLF